MSQHDLSHTSHGSSGGSASSFTHHHHPHSQLHQIFGNAAPTISTMGSPPGSNASLLNTASNTPSHNTSQRPRRKNTKPDLGYRPSANSIYTVSAGPDDASSVHYTDDGSERLSHYRRRTSRQPNLINTIVIWLKNTNKMRYIQISKFFYRWKFNASLITYHLQHPLPPAVMASTPVSLGSQSTERRNPSTPTSNLLEAIIESSENVHTTPTQSNAMEGSVTSSPQSAADNARLEQRNAYLQLFAENEKLREQLTEMKKTMKASDRAIRLHSMRVVFVTLLKKRLLTKLRYYYDIWYNNAKIIQIMNDMKQKQIELYVGLQQVQSEREYVKSLESMNSQLKMSLFLTIFFYQWKAKTAMLLLHSEREKYEKQKQIVHQELAKIRKVIEQANQLEASELKSSQLKGGAMQSSLLSIQQKLATIMHQSKEFKHQQQQLLLLQQQQLQQQLQQTPQQSNHPTTNNTTLKKTSSSASMTPNEETTRTLASTNIPFDNNSINSSNATTSKKVSGSGSKKDKFSNRN